MIEKTSASNILVHLWHTRAPFIRCFVQENKVMSMPESSKILSSVRIKAFLRILRTVTKFLTTSINPKKLSNRSDTEVFSNVSGAFVACQDSIMR